MTVICKFKVSLLSRGVPGFVIKVLIFSGSLASNGVILKKIPYLPYFLLLSAG